MKDKILILGGDPNSINSEIICKSWKKLNSSLKRKIFLISNYKLFKKQISKLNMNINLVKVDNVNQKVRNNSLKVIDIKLNFKNPFNVNKKNASEFVLKAFDYAHNLAINKKIKGIINCPIDKRLLKKKNIGVTEFLAEKNKIKKDTEAMLIWNKKLSVCPITTHIKIKDINKKIKKSLIITKISSISKNFRLIFKKKPKIGLLGLNPHNAEMESGSEEKKIILPSIKNLKRKGIKIDGPLVSDTVFISEYKKYDVIVGIYHDQVLSPFKTIFKFDAINITLGLNYLRVSPDHGTAKDLIGKNAANFSSLLKCIQFLDKFSL